MDRLTAALDRFATDGLAQMAGPQLLDRMAELLDARNRLVAELARTLQEREARERSSTTS